ncbi:hypothetical protein DNTS_027243 [Danionella cerebrum]|uniref:Uncharacterized protein n=1 Tax=Danionella cerebrum TaxID=2873325 RepID=A0A553QUH8_9TELE|nr:hypothetical protein DNTS_027243 [Danionella translucida]
MLNWMMMLLLFIRVCLSQNPIQHDPAEETELTAEQLNQVTLKQTYEHLMKSNSRVGVFIAAALGTLTLMAVVYCIYNQFYSKNIYSHAQLHDSDVALDLSSSSSSVFSGVVTDRWTDRAGGGSYGSLSVSPSIITLPPALSPPQSRGASSFHSFSMKRAAVPLRTISAQELEKSFL